MGNNFSSKYELFRNVKADDKKGLNRNYGIFLVLRRKTGLYLREHVKNRPSFAASLETWKDIIHGILHREAEAHELFPQLADSGYRDLTKILHVEVFTSIFDTPRAVLFSYEKRDPLTNNCQTVHLDISRQSVLSIKK